MPLHRQKKRVIGQLRRLNHAVRGTRNHSQAWRWPAHCLMMPAVDCGISALQQRNQQAVRRSADRVAQMARAINGVVVMQGSWDFFVNILHQRAAQRYVHKLMPAADSHERALVCGSPARNSDFKLVAGVIYVGRQGVSLRAVARRVDVPAARDQQAVQPVVDGAQRISLQASRDQHRHTAGALYGKRIRSIDPMVAGAAVGAGV